MRLRVSVKRPSSVVQPSTAVKSCTLLRSLAPRKVVPVETLPVFIPRMPG